MIKKTEYSESGQPVYHYEKADDSIVPPVITDEKYMEQYEAHLEKYLGKIEMVFHEIISSIVHLDVYHIKATEFFPYHILITGGMSLLPMTVPEGLDNFRFAELLVTLPEDWPISEESFKNPDYYWPVYYLKMLSRFPHQYQTWLGYGHTIPNGDPPSPIADTNFTGVLLVPPIKIDPKFTPLIIEEKSINFYSLVPLYQREMDFKLNKGCDALLDKFDRYEITEIIDTKRKNVCK